MTLGFTTRVIAADDGAADIAARCLQAGGLVAFPTETVYGLGADAGTARRLPGSTPPRAGRLSIP